MSNYWKKKLEELEGGNKKSSNTSSNSSNSSDYWQNKMNELDEEERKKNEDIAPTKSTLAERIREADNILDVFSRPVEDDEEEEERKWYDGFLHTPEAFSDGDITGMDIFKMSVASLADSGANVLGGVVGWGEDIVDAGATLLGVGAEKIGLQDTAKKLRTFVEGELYDEKEVARQLVKGGVLDPALGTQFLPVKGIFSAAAHLDDALNTKKVDNGFGGTTTVREDNSVYGDEADALWQSAGEVAAKKGLQIWAGGFPVGDIITGVTVFGEQSEQALKERDPDGKEDATFAQAAGSGLISAGAEIIFEKFSGGIKFGGKTLDEGLTKLISQKISSATAKNLIHYATDFAGESLEEIFTEAVSKLGTKLYKEEDLSEILYSEEALNDYIRAGFAGGLLGEFFSGGSAINATTQGRDYKSGLTANEQKVFDKVVEERIAEAEKSGEKLTTKDKNKIYDEVLEDLKKGGISTGAIESVLGGDAYKSYQDTVSSEDALIKELEELRKMKKGEMNDIQQDRLAELKAMNLTDTTKRDGLRAQLSESVQKQLVRQTKFGTQTDNYLIESYNERGRRGQAFTADTSQYDAKQAEVVQKAIDSGILNNTRRTHEFVDMVAKISADKGVLFDFTNNAKLKESGFAVDGKSVNGYVTKDGITVNIDSAKSLNSVVGHEIAHVLEGTELYTEMQNALFEYAKAKGEYQGRLDTLTKLYEGVEGADAAAELTADLVGDYLFTDSDFINNLSTEHRNVFKKIYDEIKYLVKIATAGSKEARDLEKVKRAFDNAYRESGKFEGDTKYSITNNVVDKNGKAYESVVKLEFDVFNKVSRNGKAYVDYIRNNLIKEKITVFDNDGNVETIEFAGEKERVQKDGAKNSHPVIGELTQARNALKKLVILNSVETAEISEFAKHSDENSHKWLDKNGWDERTSYVMTSDDVVYPVTLYIAKTKDGRNILYDVNVKIKEGVATDKIATSQLAKKQEGTAVRVTTPSDEGILPQKEVNVKRKFSLSSDSDGKQLTKEQSEYFKDSKMRDENGNLKVMYHGSQDAGFHTFDAKMSDDDTSFFFVDRNDVAASYSGTTETYEAKTIRTAEDMNNFIESIGVEGYEVIEKDGKFTLLYEGDRVADSNTAQGIYDEFCWYEGVGEGDANYKVYLNLTNPLEIDAKGRPWNKIDAEFSQEVYDKYKSLTAEEKAALTDLAEWEDFRVFNSEIQEARDNDLASAYAKMGEDVNIYDLFSVAADNFSEDSMRENARNYLKTRDYAQRAKEQGYDGVIFKNLVDNGGYSNGSEGASTVAIAFDSNQIKSVANEKPTGDPDIRYSLSEYTAEEKKAHNKAVLEHFGKTYSWAETGYLLLDGTRLDLSGKHDGAPGGYRTVDHRDITEALGYDYGGGDYSGSLVQFMSEGNIRIIPECNGINLSVKPTEAQEQALSSYISRYRGEVLLDIDDLNGNTVVSVEYPYGTYYTKVLNDIREWFDNGKKPENSGSYSLTKEGETPKAYGNFNIYAKDIRLAPTQEEIAPLNETTSLDMEQVEDVAPTPEDMADIFPSGPNLYDLEKELQGLEEQLAEAANANDIDTVNSLLPRYDELLKTVHKMRAEEAAENRERIASFEDADAPLEAESAYSEADTTPLNKKTLTTLTRNVRDMLACLPKDNKAIREVIEKYSTSENPSKSELFKEIREKFGEKYVYHRYADIAEVKKLLNTYKFNVSDHVKGDIADYTEFKKAHNVRTSKNALSVDILYEELSGLYPGLFPPDIINETDRFERISEVSVMPTREWVKEGDLSDDEIMQAVDLIHTEVNKYKNTEARKAAEAEAREHLDSIAPSLAKQITEAPLGDPTLRYQGIYRDEEIKTVKERIAEKLSNVEKELADNKRLRADSIVDFNREIARLQEEYSEKANKNTKVANDILRRIERLQTMRNNVDADYEKRINDLEARSEKMHSATYQTAMQRQSKMQEYNEWAAELIGDTTTWRDKKLGISYKTSTLKRNLRDVVRDARGSRDIAKADAIYDELQGKYNHNEAELNREANRIKKVFADMKITAAEDAYIQMLGELLYNPETTLTADNVNKYYEAHKSKIDIDKVNEAIKLARANYDSLLERVNEVLSEQGMKEIPYRKGYFPHFTEEKQSRLAKLFNWKTHNTEIPTSIAGLTEEFTPNRSWQSFNKERYTDTTDYSFTKGFDTYVQGALDWIYHIEDIQKRRAFENQLRYIHSEQGIKDRVEALFNNEEYDADELQEQIDLVYREARNPLNNFVTDLRAGTNTLANKKSSMDRGMEEATNRKFYSTMTNINNRVTGNMVVGSVSSALTNFIPITQSWSQVSPFSSLRAAGETIRSTFRDDGVIDKSDFLTNRLKKADNLYKTTWDKISDKAAFMMEGVDFFTSQTVWRSKYRENLSKGMSESEAIKNADQFAEGILAGRSRGNQPTLFDSKNPLIKAFTAFQLEVNNQYGYMFKDMPQDMKNESTAKLVKGYVAMFVGAYAYNALSSALTGRNAAFDPIRIIQELLGDLFDEDEEKEPIDAVMNLANNVIEELPFVGGLFGGGRIPISSMLPYGEGLPEMIDGTYQDLKDEDWSNLTKEWLNPLYYLAMPFGGGQLKKTVEGLSMFSEDHPIAGSYTASGNLRFPVEDTFANRLQAAIFGQWANKNARDYFDNDIAPLNENQTEEYIDVGMSIQDYWEYRKGLKGLKTLEEKAEYINSLDLTDKQKNILINNIADRKDDLDMSNYGDFGSFEEFDYASKNPEKYAFLKENGISYDDYNASEESREAYSWAYNNPEKYTLSKAISSDVVTYRKYTSELYDIKADKDEDGKSISGSRKEKVIDYINNLDADYGEKIILFKSEYNADDTYNYEIIDYLNSREDISYTEMETILKELGFTVDSKGNIYWD